MRTTANTIPAWKIQAERALAWRASTPAERENPHQADRRDNNPTPRQAYTEDTPERPAMQLVGYWVAGGRNTLQKIIGWGLPDMGRACEMVNDYAKRFPAYTFAAGMVTATYNKIGWSTAAYRYDPDTRRCYTMMDEIA